MISGSLPEDPFPKGGSQVSRKAKADGLAQEGGQQVAPVWVAESPGDQSSNISDGIGDRRKNEQSHEREASHPVYHPPIPYSVFSWILYQGSRGKTSGITGRFADGRT